MKKIALIALSALVLTGCASGVPDSQNPGPTKEPSLTVAYAVPADCDVEGLIQQAPGWEAVDQTDEDVVDQLDCAIGTPNSDVGVWFGYNKRSDEQWVAVTEALKGEGYVPFDAQVAEADVWRMEDPSIETGPVCKLSGHIGEVSFSATEPWVQCDDDWNRELVTLLVDHARR